MESTESDRIIERKDSDGVSETTMYPINEYASNVRCHTGAPMRLRDAEAKADDDISDSFGLSTNWTPWFIIQSMKWYRTLR